MSSRRALAYGALLALLMASLAFPTVDAMAGWNATSYAGWPGVGISALLFLMAGWSRRWVMFAAQTASIGVVLAVSYQVPWWAGAAASVAVTLPGLLTSGGLRSHQPAFRRFNEGEVDAYHGVTAASGLLCGVLSGAAAAAAGRGDLPQVLLTGLIAFFAATTAQLVILPFWLRSAGGWRSLGSTIELWTQRVMLLVFTVGIFAMDSALPVSFLLFPVLGWAAIRAAPAETHVQVLVVSVAAFAATVVGRGPLALGSLQDPSAFAPLLVYMFMAAVCYLLVPLALTVERLTAMTRQATAAATTVERMLDSATGTVFIGTDAAGAITHYNYGAEQALGYGVEEVLGRRPSMFHTDAELARQARDFGIPVGDPAERFSAVVAAQISLGLPRDWEFRRKDGDRRMLSLTISEMTEPGGEVVGRIAAGEDITERLRAQRALEQALEREHASVVALREADQVKQELVSTVSHELRTPITSIQGFAELLIDGDLGTLTDEQLGALDRIDRNSARLHLLVDDLLTLAKTEADASEMVAEPVDLNEVVREVHELLARQLANRNMKVLVELGDCPVVVGGDRALLERAISNLWSNAIKFTPDGGTIRLQVEEVRAHAAGPTGVVTVSDTGVGISPDEHAAVFTRFYRTAIAGERAIQGSGLGLSIVQSIVDQHHGHIALESAPGTGTVVRIAIPTAA